MLPHRGRGVFAMRMAVIVMHVVICCRGGVQRRGSGIVGDDGRGVADRPTTERCNRKGVARWDCVYAVSLCMRGRGVDTSPPRQRHPRHEIPSFTTSCTADIPVVGSLALCATTDTPAAYCPRFNCLSVCVCAAAYR